MNGLGFLAECLIWRSDGLLIGFLPHTSHCIFRHDLINMFEAFYRHITNKEWRN